MSTGPAWTWLRTLMLGVLAVLLWLPALPAEAQTTATGFDHLRTGFALTGRHATTSCESCHQGGVLQGTPRDCASCHRAGQRFARGNVVMSSTHLPTQQTCESCHDAKTFAAAKFNHAGVAAGCCASCHNGSSASGKSTSHLTTRASCDACHRTGASWSQLAAFDHAAVLPAACSSCHNGTRARASGKPANHIQTAATPAMAAADCDTCHKGSFTSWANGRLHASVNVTTGCASCHSGTQLGAGGKPSTPVHANVTGNCESCHKSASTWTGAKVDHATFNDTTACGSCHNGTQGVTGRSATHMPSGSTSCAVCHGTGAWTPSKWNHTQMAVAAQCASCHTGGYPPADGRPANHIPYATLAATASANCDTCHKGSTTTWANGRLHANASIATGCAACHTGSYLAAVGKPSNALHATVGSDCEICHKSTSAWAGAKVDHSGYNDSTTCANCHNGSTATGKGSTHIPAGSTNCLTCHNTTAWAPSKWTHAQLAVTGQCASCHSGGYPPADGRPANHIPYASVAATASANCDACHKGSFSSWANGRLHSNFSVSTGCVTCHNATFLSAVGKPSNPVHATVTGNCESCHKSTATWSGAKVDHSTFNDGTACATCHNGTGATGKPATHIPAGTLNCTSCHTTAAWAPSKWNHTQLPVAAQCASCHTGGYPPADGRASNHIPYTSVPAAASANCDTCHKGSYATWATGKLHANVSVSSGCATCHTGTFLNAVGKPGNAVHATVTGNCESCHKSTSTWSGAKVDHTTFNDGTICSSCHNGSSATGKPASHIPAGSLNCTSCHTTASWVPSKWNHTQMAVASQCASCHTGGYPPADGRVANHIPYASIPVAAAASCDACHKGSYATWANGRFHPNFGVSTSCATCHTGTFLNAVGKPGNAVHATVTGNCESCHKSTSTWAGAKVDHSTFNDSTVCSTCHNGSTATGKSATHIPSGSLNCTSCHTTVSWAPSKWNHTQLPVAAQCASCHTGGYPPADGRVSNHIPYASVPAAASANCDTCHKGSYSTWATGRFHANISVSAGCATCHTGSYLNAVGKPSTPIHATVTGNCESCHKSTSTWAGAKVDHTTFNDSTVCASCHNGSSATGKSATHIPSGSANCYSCHSVTTWAPSKWTHTQLPVVGQCASCHTGGYPPADGRVANHIPYASVPVAAGANCDACHKGSYSSWANGRFHTNYSVSTGCATCHTGTFLNAVGKPSNAVHATVTGNCESCHKSTATWSGAKVDHSTFNDSTVCSSCHNGSAATGKPGSHIPSGSTNCYSCHSVTTWAPSKWNHTQLPVAAQCATCHTGGYPPADGKASNHIPYASVPVAAGANCDACHKGSYTTWANGRFHTNYSVSTGCYTCHTGAYLNAVGKPSNPIHATVTGNCETCHKSTASWSGAKVDHSTFNDSTVCSSCHNGTSATGKSATHIPSGSTNCYTCHSVTSWVPSKWNHTQLPVVAQCATCHSGGYPPADGRVANHIPYTSLPVAAGANCDACHKGSYASWATGRFHANYSVSAGCFTCHTGSYLNAVGKPSNAIHATVTGTCESCHKSTASWSGAKVDHSTFNDTTVCSSCHNGTAATGKSATHIPSGSTNCYTCHSVTSWVPSKWNHTQLPVTAQCATCHSGGYPPADGRVANHVPYASVPVAAGANCDACHKGSYATWANGRFHANFSVSAGCFTCHTGSYLSAVGKPSNAIHATVTGNCETCHKSTTSWSGAKVDHSTFNDTTVCSSCHNGTAATGKSATHIPSGSTNCYTCHSVTSWVPSKWNHTQLPVTAQCATCHSGGYPPADGRVANHVPYASVPIAAGANCDSCHKGSYATWANGRFHANYSVSAGCFTCHTGSYLNAVGKPSNAVHATVTGNCESCHKSTSSWSGAKVDHSTFNDTTVCSSCHNGTAATGKSATHIPSGSTNCYTCHSVTSWVPSKWNHTQLPVTAQCATCHTGGYPPADGRVANHVPYASVPVAAGANCDACHKGSYATWTNGRFHANFSVSAGCFTCHTGGYLAAVGKPSNAVHATVTGTCEACHKSTTTWSGAKVDHSTFNDTTVCSSCHNGTGATGKPGTHIPVGATNCYTCHSVTGWRPTKWNHTQLPVTAQCATCHSGGYPPADGRVANHIPYASVPVAAGANCDSCHKGSYATWANGRFHANYSVSTGCFSCHTGSYLAAVGKPSNAVHATVTGTCEACHKSTTTWSGAKVDHSTFNDTTVCASCHNGTGATGKPGTHIPVGATNCYTCHSVTGWRPTKWNHTQLPVTAQCATCHTGGYPPADGRVANHIPYASVPVAAGANCDSCHKGSYATWANGRFHANFSVSTGCFSCHTGAYLSAVGKPSNPIHATVTGSCETCHKSTTSWSSISYTHSAANAVGTGTCDTCHNGSTATGKNAAHIPVPAGAARCDSCHRSQASWKTSVTMNHTVVTGGTCKSCHGGAYVSVNALAKPTNHIPESQLLNGTTMDCNACHTSTTSWSSQRMNHNSSQGNGAGWCKSCHQSGTSYLGSMEKKSLTHEKSTGVTDCSQSGCHRPLGSKGTPYTKWD